MISAATWIQLFLGVVGTINLYVMFGLNRSAKKRDEHDLAHQCIEKRLMKLEDGQLTEEKFRKILVDELGAFELRLINDGRLDPLTKKQRKNDN